MRIPKEVWDELIKDKRFVEIQNRIRKKYGFGELIL